MTRFTLATLKTTAGPRAAIGVGDKYYQLSTMLPKASPTVKELLEDWATSFPMLQSLADDIAGAKCNENFSNADISDVELLTPVLYPNKLISVGANYSGHLKEMGLTAQKWDIIPFFLSPPTTCLIGPEETVSIPRSTKEFDWELELVMVVGKKLRHASCEEAAKGIAGYSIGLDLF